MSIEDKELIEELKKIAAKKKIKFRSLEIAQIKNIAESTLKNKLANKSESFIDFYCLVKMYKAISNDNALEIYETLLPTLKCFIEIKKAEEIQKINTIYSSLKCICTCDFVFVSIKSLKNLNEIITTLFDSKSHTKAINLSLNQELLFDAISLIESYAYGNQGNFSDELKIKLFVPKYTVFANLIAGQKDDMLSALIQDEDEQFIEMSDIGKSIVNCEIKVQLHQIPAWEDLPKSPELRLIIKMKRDGVKISDNLLKTVTERYEIQPYKKGNVFERLLALDKDIPTDYLTLIKA